VEARFTFACIEEASSQSLPRQASSSFSAIPFYLAAKSEAAQAGLNSVIPTMSLTSRRLVTALVLVFGPAMTFGAFRFFELIKEDVIRLFKLPPSGPAAASERRHGQDPRSVERIGDQRWEAKGTGEVLSSFI
ncbi:MAG: hypothetical protein WBX25_13940, partial [Rhodomicrobium sp.]